jgi:hypothetical protein
VQKNCFRDGVFHSRRTGPDFNGHDPHSANTLSSDLNGHDAPRSFLGSIVSRVFVTEAAARALFVRMSCS